MDLINSTSISIRQRKELAELFGFETRNKYEIQDENGQPIGFAAEQNKGFFGHIARHFLGHWRTFEIHFFNNDKQEIFRANHPFRIFFQRMDISLPGGQKVGALQQRFSIFTKKFDIEDSNGRVVLTVSSPLWKIWTFSFKNLSRAESAVIKKKWSGLIKEAFTDADNFKLEFKDRNLSLEVRQTLVSAAIFIDLQYFEKHANN